MIQSFGVEVTDAAGTIGGRWDQGFTEVELWPRVQPPVSGVWNSRSPGDIYSPVRGTGMQPPTIQRNYDFHSARETLYLRVRSENTENVINKKTKKLEIEYVPTTTVLSLDDFDINTPLGSSGTGNFYLERKTFAVNWRVYAVAEGKEWKPDAVPAKDKTALDRPYRIEPNDPALIKRTTQGFQEYEYFSDQQECLYVGRSGGKDGKDPSSWVDRLKKEHIATEWILEAKTVVILYGLTLQEAKAEEEFRIRGGNGRANKQQGDFSSGNPPGDLASNAQAAERHGSRERFRLVLFPK